MRLYCLERELWVPRPLDEVFAFFSRPENLQSITPPWLNFRMVESPPILAAEALVRYSMRWHWMPVQWTSEIKVWNPPHRFVDRQISGPYTLWNHEHSFSASPGGTVMRDFVTYALPLGAIGRFAHALFVRREIESVFDFRAKTLQQKFAVAT